MLNLYQLFYFTTLLVCQGTTIVSAMRPLQNRKIIAIKMGLIIASTLVERARDFSMRRFEVQFSLDTGFSG